MSRLLITAGVPAAVLLLAGCDGMAGFDQQVTEDFHQSYQMPAGGHLDLTNRNGSLEVSGWDRDQVEVAGTKYARDNEGLRRVKVDIRQDGDHLTVRTDVGRDDSWMGGNGGVRYRIHVPHRFLLDRLETTNGSINVQDLEGGGELRSTNGKVSLARAKGDYRAQTTNGSIGVEDCDGQMRLYTTNGSAKGHLGSGALQARSTNGSLNFSIDKPAPDQPVKLSTTNGSITVALAEFHHNDLRAESTHGSITMRLPENVNANLRAETSLASIHSDIPLTSVEEQSKHNVRAKLGAGGAEVEASTSTGSIRVERY